MKRLVYALVVLSAALAQAQPLSNAPTTDTGLSRGGDTRTDVSLRRAPGGAGVGTPTATPLLFNTNTATPTVTTTGTVTQTAAATATATATPTPTALGGNEVFFACIPGGAGRFCGTVMDASGTDVRDHFTLPPGVNIRVQDLAVECSAANGASGTLTFTVADNGSDIAMTACGIVGTGGTQCAVHGIGVDVNTGHTLSIHIGSTGTVNSPNYMCRMAMAYTKGGTNDQGANALLFGLGESGGPASNTTYAASWHTAGDNTPTTYWRSIGAVGDANAMNLMGPGVTITGWAMSGVDATDLNPFVAGSEQFTIWKRSGGSSSNTDLTGTFNTGTSAFSGSCTTNCTLAAGDGFGVTMVNGNQTTFSWYPKLALAFSGAGTPVVQNWKDTFSPALWYGPLGVSSVSTKACHPVAACMVFKNLQVRVDAAQNAAQTLTFTSGATAGTVADDANFKCTTGTGAGATCSDTTHSVLVAAGSDFCIHSTAASSTSNSFTHVGLEGVDCTRTPTATATATATGTVTATPTITNTAGPTNTPATINPTPGSADYGTVDDSHFGQINLLMSDNLLTNFGLAVIVVKWDTSAIPDGATIDSASVDFHTKVTNCVTNTDSFTGVFGWYTAPGSWTAGDYTAVTDNSAYDTAPDNIGVAFDICGNHLFNLNLSNPNTAGHINKTGYSAIRGWVKRSGAPTGNNIVNFNGSNSVPTLHVTYH